MRRILATLVATLISLAVPFFIAHAAGAEISGLPRIIDGDTVAIGEERIRLHGIDAPEQKQTCSVGGIEWACGRAATVALTEMIGSHIIICKGKKRDRYKRLIAVCYAGPVNLNAGMVKKGWALAYRRYSKEYVSAEREAENGMLGIWRGEFVPPWDWRRK